MTEDGELSILGLSGKVALITGGGAGIGRATAELFVKAGMRVAIAEIDEARAEDTRRALVAVRADAVVIAADVRKAGDVGRVIGEVDKHFGRLDVLVNNAAWVRYQAIPDVAPETVDRMVEIGFKAVIWGVQAAAEVMDLERGGTIVNLASVAGIVSARNSIVYSGIKAGVMGITRAAAAELGYVPDAAARSLKVRRTEQLALAVADLGNPVYVAMMRAVEGVVRSAGYRLVVSATGSEPDEEVAIIRGLARGYADGLILNPGAWTHYAWSLRDAVEIAGLPMVEVHLSDVDSREAFRHVSVLEAVRYGKVAGKGVDGYREGLELLMKAWA